MAEEYARQADRLLASSVKDKLAAQRFKARAERAQRAISAAIDSQTSARARASSKLEGSDVSTLLHSYTRVTASTVAGTPSGGMSTQAAPPPPPTASTPSSEARALTLRSARGEALCALAADSLQRAQDPGQPSDLSLVSTDTAVLANNLSVRAYQASLLCIHLSREAKSLRVRHPLPAPARRAVTQR